MPKMYLDPKKEVIPEPGDTYRVIGVYPGTTDELWRSRVEVVLVLEKNDKEKGEQK